MVSSLIHNEIGCSICHKIILQHLGLRCSIEGDPIKREDLTYEQAVNYYCINVVVHHYIKIALDSLFFGEEESSQLCNKGMKAKVRWNIWQVN